jgi:uncharacterized membrane protein YhaH (DUF805 family)
VCHLLTFICFAQVWYYRVSRRIFFFFFFFLLPIDSNSLFVYQRYKQDSPSVGESEAHIAAEKSTTATLAEQSAPLIDGDNTTQSTSSSGSSATSVVTREEWLANTEKRRRELWLSILGIIVICCIYVGVIYGIARIFIICAESGSSLDWIPYAWGTIFPSIIWALAVLPQLLLNYRRQSTHGLAMPMILLNLIAAVFAIIALGLSSTLVFWAMLPYASDVATCSLLCLQWFWYHDKPPIEDTNTIDSNAAHITDNKAIDAATNNTTLPSRVFSVAGSTSASLSSSVVGSSTTTSLPTRSGDIHARTDEPVNSNGYDMHEAESKTF